MNNQNTRNKILTKPTESHVQGGPGHQQNVQGKKMAHIINSEEIEVKVDSVHFKEKLIQARNAKGLN